MKYQGLRDVYQITQWKDGCVFKTKKIGRAWIDIDGKVELPGDIQLCSISTSESLNLQTIRKVDDSTEPLICLWD